MQTLQKQKIVLQVLEHLREKHDGEISLREVHDKEIEEYTKEENGEK